MPDPIDRALLEHVATLASLSLTDAEATAMTRDVASILRYIAELDALDTTDVPPTAQVGARRAPAFHADEVRPGLSNEEALAQAPRVSGGGFAVPVFVESDG